jgi:hypothetical protein
LRSGAILDELRRDLEARPKADSDYRSAVLQHPTETLDFERAQVRAPHNGPVTNLSLRTGDYAVAGNALMALVDSDSSRIGNISRRGKCRRSDSAQSRDPAAGLDKPANRACQEHCSRDRGSPAIRRPRQSRKHQSILHMGPSGTTCSGSNRGGLRSPKHHAGRPSIGHGRHPEGIYRRAPAHPLTAMKVQDVL